ncbi:hypothetical protein [Sodalis sp.]|uniref:hypothetical protein n=1 Tax=Sodalis sp. (in: enterobacteria) TaxID=1898979 RepID=UPI0038737B65
MLSLLQEESGDQYRVDHWLHGLDGDTAIFCFAGYRFAWRAAPAASRYATAALDRILDSIGITAIVHCWWSPPYLTSPILQESQQRSRPALAGVNGVVSPHS